MSGELDVLILVPQPGAHALPGHVVDADPHHEPEHLVTGGGQKSELLAAQVARENSARALGLAAPVA